MCTQQPLSINVPQVTEQYGSIGSLMVFGGVTGESTDDAPLNEQECKPAQTSEDPSSNPLAQPREFTPQFAYNISEELISTLIWIKDLSACKLMKINTRHMNALVDKAIAALDAKAYNEEYLLKVCQIMTGCQDSILMLSAALEKNDEVNKKARDELVGSLGEILLNYGIKYGDGYKRNSFMLKFGEVIESLIQHTINNAIVCDEKTNAILIDLASRPLKNRNMTRETAMVLKNTIKKNVVMTKHYAAFKDYIKKEGAVFDCFVAMIRDMSIDETNKTVHQHFIDIIKYLSGRIGAIQYIHESDFTAVDSVADKIKIDKYTNTYLIGGNDKHVSRL